MKPDSDKFQESQQSAGGTRKPQRYRFEYSFTQLLLRAFGAVMVCSWMFALGVLVGRGVPVADSDDVSLRTQFMRILGLTREPAGRSGRAAEIWEDPEKTLAELDYHTALTQRPHSSPEKSSGKSESYVKGRVPKTAAAPATAHSTQESARSEEQAPGKKEEAPPPAIVPATGQFSVLIASMSRQENAQKMLQQLQSKGYSPQMEVIKNAEGVRWYRILVGSFKDRDEAQRYAADLNRREKLQAMAIRTGP
jgi:cell division septation protein DedD